jgi:hypothetical protein
VFPPSDFLADCHGVCGIAMIALLTSPMKMMLIPGVVFYLIITFFLFRPAANAYFSQKG